MKRLTYFAFFILGISLPALAQAGTCYLSTTAPSNVIQYGQATTLSWSSDIAVPFNLTNVGSNLTTPGSTVVAPAQTTDYTGSLLGPGGVIGTCTLRLYVLPPAPTALNASCNAAGTQATISWNSVPGASSYGVRVNDTTNDSSGCFDGWDCSDPPDKVVDYYGSTVYTATVIPGHRYTWWVYGINTLSGGGATANGPSFTCTAPVANCSFNGQTVLSGSSVTAYQSSSVAYGSSCSTISQTRTCNNGTLSGSYAYSSCTVAAPANCTFNGQTVLSGSSVTAYQTSTVSYGSSCSSVSQTRSCTNGVLSGSYAYSSCSVGAAPAPTCSVTFDQNPIASGGSTFLRWNSSNASTFYINSVGYVSSSGSTLVGPLTTTNYSGTVSGPGGGGSCPATLSVTPPSVPIATITASSTSIQVGQSTGLKATFVAGSGDVLTGDNIDSPVGTGLGANTNPGTKYVTFTPASPGTYIFYARATSQYYTSWTTYATAAVTVTAAPTCTPAYSCSGSTIQYTDSTCHTSTYTTCASPSFCSTGSSVCLYPQATSTLQVLPSLVKSGNSAQVSWLSQNTASCTVAGSNGDAWSGTSSTKTSSGIVNKTTYTLSCLGLDGATTTQQASVTILPKFCETGASNCQ